MLGLFPDVLPAPQRPGPSAAISSLAGRGLVRSQKHQDRGKKPEELYKQARLVASDQQEPSQ